MKKIIVGQNKITINDVWDVANKNALVLISDRAKSRIGKCRQVIEEIIKEGRVAYGINTGFGKLKDKIIPKDKIKQLQVNLIRSHSVGVGEPFSEMEARAIIFVRLVSLAQGFSGVRIELVEKLAEFLNKGVYPYIPSQGSVGASGDLAPLSHMALTLIGEGEIFYKNKWLPAEKALDLLRIKPIQLAEKEGLALNNGTAVMTAIAVPNLRGAINLAKVADLAGALSLEVLMGTLTAFDERIHNIRPHYGQATVAKNFRELCRKSRIMESHRDCNRVQDSYSLRCIPQVHGAVRDAIDYCKEKVEIEINSVTDNPLIFSKEKKVMSGGNFHGEPIALAMDFLAIAISELGDISERRTYKMLDPNLSEGLPPFLIYGKDVGLNSGFMMVQYTAASLVAENRIYVHPVSVDSIPTCAGQEDHVSFGTIAANKCKKVIENVENILAIELLCGAQAADLKKPLKLGKGTQITFKRIRKDVKMATQDREFHNDIKRIKDLITKDALMEELMKKNIKIK